MWSSFEGDKDVFEEDCTVLESVIFVVISLLSRRRRTEFGKVSSLTGFWVG